MAEYADFVFAEMEKAEKELKPCPFCGHRKIMILMDNDPRYRNNRLRFRAICERCHVRMDRDKIPQLVESWNRRTDN